MRLLLRSRPSERVGARDEACVWWSFKTDLILHALTIEWLGRRVRDSLRVELGVGICLRRRADGSVATLRGAEGEPGHVGRGNEDCFADERV